MISSPKCHISKQFSNKVCINKICTQPAFICKYCQDDDCELLHNHNNQLQVLRWNQITSLTQKIEVLANSNKQFVQNIGKLRKQINKLVDDVNGIIQIYRKRVEQYDKQIKMDPQFKRVWENMKKEKWDLITGSQIRLMYDKLKQDSFMMNKEEIRVMKEKESKNVNFLLDDINKKLSEYLKCNIKQIPSVWSKEQVQQLKVYNQQIKENPKNSDIYYGRGNIYYNRNQLEKALSDYNKAIEIDPKYSNAYNNRGWLYYNRRQLQNALSDYNKAIECDTKNSAAYCNRGNLYYNRNQLEKALADYTKAIECTKKALYFNNRALVYRKLKKIKQAESDQKKCDELSK